MEHDETLERLVFRATNFEHGKAVNTLIRKDPFRCNVQPLNGRVLRGEVHYQVQEVEYWGSYQRVRLMRVDIGPYKTP
jgi:hypothetical protein